MFSFPYAESSAMVTRMRMSGFPNKHGGGEEEEGGREGGGQQKAAAAPPEPGQKTRTQRLMGPVYSGPKPG